MKENKSERTGSVVMSQLAKALASKPNTGLGSLRNKLTHGKHSVLLRLKNNKAISSI